MDSLHIIGKSYNCDKSDDHHTFEGESYFDIYEKYFSKLRDKNINFLELGVRDASSLNTWATYFDNANIHGVDIDSNAKLFQTGLFQIHIFSQDNDAKLGGLSDMVGGWDVVLDDASHINELTLKSFSILWGSVKSGGLYIIEDLANSYRDLTEDCKNWNGMGLNDSKISFNNRREDMMALFSDIISNLDGRFGNIRSIHFHQQIVIIEKI